MLLLASSSLYHRSAAAAYCHFTKPWTAAKEKSAPHNSNPDRSGRSQVGIQAPARDATNLLKNQSPLLQPQQQSKIGH